MDIFCGSWLALVFGCDDDAQISSEYEEEGEQNVSSKSVAVLSHQAGANIIKAKKGTTVSSFSAGGGSLLCCAIPLLTLPIFFIWFIFLTDKVC
mmetsp:Transcript_23601/g.38186  ORF Transcript_23601/g.38186 Transcript_23601/m.38186 type:complete len:94 (+) Transcript_23601:1032-1313(+)